jgi:hypothetical protein
MLNRGRAVVDFGRRRMTTWCHTPLVTLDRTACGHVEENAVQAVTHAATHTAPVPATRPRAERISSALAILVLIFDGVICERAKEEDER